MREIHSTQITVANSCSLILISMDFYGKSQKVAAKIFSINKDISFVVLCVVKSLYKEVVGTAMGISPSTSKLVHK